MSEFRTAVVTGGAAGIGLALGRALARRGAWVVLADRDGEAAADAAACLARETGARVEGVEVDVTRVADLKAAVDDLVARAGRLDLLVNNAGVGLAGQLRDQGPGDWEPVIDVNLRGVLNGIAAGYPHMVRQGAGHILNVASGAGLLPRPGMAAYAASKHAVVGLSTSLRLEAAPLGVRVSAACPGPVDTGILERTRFSNVDVAALRREIARVPRPVQPLDPDVCAARILRGVARDRAVIVADRIVRLEWFLYRLFPRLGTLLARWRGEKLRGLRAAPRLTGSAA